MRMNKEAFRSKDKFGCKHKVQARHKLKKKKNPRGIKLLRIPVLLENEDGLKLESLPKY